jgi:hypothetical protein
MALLRGQIADDVRRHGAVQPEPEISGATVEAAVEAAIPPVTRVEP